jgi:hypothetical protein
MRTKSKYFILRMIQNNLVHVVCLGVFLIGRCSVQYIYVYIYTQTYMWLILNRTCTFFTTDINCRSYYRLWNSENIISSYVAGPNLGTCTYRGWHIFTETCRSSVSTIGMYLILCIRLVLINAYNDPKYTK